MGPRVQLYLYLCLVVVAGVWLRVGSALVVSTDLTWAGGDDECNCTLFSAGGSGYAYACTEGLGSGDWSGGVKYFQDGFQRGARLILQQITISINGNFDCFAAHNVTIMLNQQYLGIITTPANDAQVCPQCRNCYDSSSPLSLQSALFGDGISFYNIGVPNEISLLVSGNNNRDVNTSFCLSLASVDMTFAKAEEQDGGSSSDSHWGLDAPPWFWTLVASVGVIVVVLLITVFLLWRRRREDKLSYKPLTSSTEYVDPNQLGDISIDVNELAIDKEIGQGSFGLVYRAKWRGTEVAVKRLPAGSIPNEQVLLEFMKEAFIMRQLRHPNVLQVLGVCLEPASIVMEYMPKGSLNHLIKNPEVVFIWPIIQKIAVEISQGMAYLHGCNPPLIHRDLKPHNILVDETWRVKVCDFGLSRYLELKKDMTACGTPAYAAPEVLRNAAYTVAADVYSFGILLWELTTREPLYPGMPPFQIIFAVGTQNSRPAIPENLDAGIAELIEDCWDDNPDSRPSFVQLAERISNMRPHFIRSP